MVEHSTITSYITVQELLEKYPMTLHIFMDMGLLCAGCPAEAFHTLAEVAKEYNLDVDQLLRHINKCVRDDASPR